MMRVTIPYIARGTLSFAVFFVISKARATSGDLLANLFFTTEWGSNLNFTRSPRGENLFYLEIEEYTRVEWKDALNVNRTGEFFTLNSSESSYDAFLSLVTDGKDLLIGPAMMEERSHGGSSISSMGFRNSPHLESDMFQNQTGCTNGVDLEGNLIQSVLLRMDFETFFFPEWNKTKSRYNFTVLFEGRPLHLNEGALAVVDIAGGHESGLGDSVWTVDLVVQEGPFWALQRHIVDFEIVKQNEAIPIKDEYGTHTMRELLTNGIDGFFRTETNASLGVAWRESNLFRGDPACFNEIDLEGSYIEKVGLTFDRIESSGENFHIHTVSPRFVFWGRLGKAPTPEPTLAPTIAPTHSAAARILLPLTMRWSLLFVMAVFGLLVFGGSHLAPSCSSTMDLRS